MRTWAGSAALPAGRAIRILGILVDYVAGSLLLSSARLLIRSQPSRTLDVVKTALLLEALPWESIAAETLAIKNLMGVWFNMRPLLTVGFVLASRLITY